jgi:hypothetical protein
MGKGTIQVQIAFDQADLKSAGIPVEVRQLSTVIIAQGITGQPIAVDPGIYLVTATLPGSDELFQRVEVGSGESKIVQLTPPTVDQVTAQLSSPGATTQQYFAGSAEPPPADSTPSFKSMFPAGADDISEADSEYVSAPDDLLRLPRTAGWPTERTVFLRLLYGDPFAPPLRTLGGLRIVFFASDAAAPQDGPIGQQLHQLPLLTAGAGQSVSNGPIERWVSIDTYQLTLTMPAPSTVKYGAFWLRITAPPDRARYVAVPALPGGRCVLLLTLGGTRRAVSNDFHLIDPDMDLLLYYHQHGNAPQAAAMLQTDGIKQRASDSPVYQALVGYAALRLGGTSFDELMGAVLASSDPDAPDMRAIRGEFLARQGRHQEAQELFTHSSEGGLPIFSDGLGYLSSRIPQYLRLKPTNGERLAQSWDKLRPFLVVADLKSIVLTLRGDILKYRDK